MNYTTNLLATRTSPAISNLTLTISSTTLSSTTTVINRKVYCDLNEFTRDYRDHWHGYLSIMVCVLGSIANVLNICVLTTRDMRWPTNYILTGLAVADLLVMLEYIPYAGHTYLSPDSRLTVNYFSYSWAIYMFFHALFAQVCHFISCCLTVILAIWRYVAISQPRNTPLMETVTSLPRTVLAIFLTYLWCPLICLPLFMYLKISIETHIFDANDELIPRRLLSNYTEAMHKESIYLVQLNGNFRIISLVIYSIIIKLMPCVLLSILSEGIINVLVRTKERRRQLMNSCAAVPLVEITKDGKSHSKPSTQIHKRLTDKEQQTDRTTCMLLAVLLLFLVTELPQALLGLFSMLLGEQFEMQCMQPLGDIMDMLALTNSAINFVLYCSMSRQFRTVFIDLFIPKTFNKWYSICTNGSKRNHQNGVNLNGHLQQNGRTTQVTLV